MPGLPPTIADATVTLTWGAAGQYYGYCTLKDVQYEFTDDDAYGTLDASAVGQEISNAAVEMQQILEHLYIMPYTGSDAGVLATLRDMNAKLAVANLIDRYFQGAVPNESATSVERRHWVESILVDLRTASIRWDAPFADALPRAQLPVYQLSTLAQLSPTQGPDTRPIFTIRRSVWRDDVM